MTKLLNIEQGSEEWLKLRGTMVTGTGLADSLSSNKTRDTKKNKMLVALMGVSEHENITSKDMERGNLYEDEALEYFNQNTELFAQSVGMMISEDIPLFGVSPDGVIYDCEFEQNKIIGGVELKVPRPSTHLKYINNGEIPSEYFNQIVSMFLVDNDVECWYFMSYCPELVETEYAHLADFTLKILREDLDNLIKTYYSKKRTDKYESLEEIKDKLIEFTTEVQNEFNQLKLKGE